MKKIIIIILAFHLGLSNICGQDDIKITILDQVTLIDGNTIQGEFISEDSDQLILLVDGNEYIIKKDLILKKSKLLVNGIPEESDIDYTSFSTPRFETEMSVYSLLNEDHQGVGIELKGHYFFRNHFGLGLGIALDQYKSLFTEKILPITFGIKGFLKTKKVTPFYSLNVGYGIAFKDESEGLISARGGYVLNPIIGIQIRGKHTGIQFFSGMKFQKADFESGDNFGQGTIERNMVFTRFILGIGASF